MFFISLTKTLTQAYSRYSNVVLLHFVHKPLPCKRSADERSSKNQGPLISGASQGRRFGQRIEAFTQPVSHVRRWLPQQRDKTVEYIRGGHCHHLTYISSTSVKTWWNTKKKSTHSQAVPSCHSHDDKFSKVLLTFGSKSDGMCSRKTSAELHRPTMAYGHAFSGYMIIL